MSPFAESRNTTRSNIDGLRPVSVIDVESMTSFELPHSGEQHFGDWLRDHGYLHIEDIPLDLQALDLLYTEHLSRYALYHPILVDPDTECLFINIPSQSGCVVLLPRLNDFNDPNLE